MLSLIKNLTKSGSDRKVVDRKVTRRGYRPALEGLEGRISLSGVGTVATVVPGQISNTPPTTKKS